MRVDRLKAAAVAELTTEVAAAKAKRDTLEATTVQALWLADLGTFDEAWAGYTAWRHGTYESAAVAATGEKKTVRKATAAKAAPAKAKPAAKVPVKAAAVPVKAAAPVKAVKA